jgi:HEAT repeat protein
MTDPITELCQLIAEQRRNNPEIAPAALLALVEATNPELVAQVEAMNPELVAALKSDGRVQQINRDGSHGFQTLVQGGVANVGTHYHVDAEKLGEVLQAVLHRMQTTEIETVDFQPYLQSLCDDDTYREWQDLYTPTTVEGRTPSPQTRFSRRLRLRVETVEPPKQETAAASEPEPHEQFEQFDVLDGLKKYASEHVLLIGKPGSGKSTSLEWLLWTEASHALDNPTAKIPVLVRLRRCTSTIEGLIQDFLSHHQLPLGQATIEHLLQRGKLLLLLDGLNELPEAFRTEIANFRDKYRKTTPMIVSTRDLSVGGTLDIAKTLTMLPLTEPQMQEFVRGYLGEAGDRLFRQLKGDRLQKFAETPLLLWMLCRVFAQNGQVPANLGLAFREFTHLYDQGTQAQQAIQADAPVDSRTQWPKLLRHLAFELMHDREPVEFRLSMLREEAETLLTTCLQQEGRANARACAERWLQDLLDYHLIQPVIQPNFEQHIEFRHQLIQEYYAAEYLLRLLPELSDEQLKRNYLNYLKWTEPIALMLALVDDEAQALRVVKLAMDEVDLMLGARLAGEVHLDYQEQTTNYILQKSIPEWLKVELLGRSRTKIAKQALSQYLTNPDVRIVLISAAFIGETSEQSAADEVSRKLEDIDDQFFSQASYGGSDHTGSIWTAYVEALSYIAPHKAIAFLKGKILNEEGINFDARVHYHTEAGRLLMRLDSDSLFPILKNSLENLQKKSQTPLTPEERLNWAETSSHLGKSPDELSNIGLDNCKSILLSLLSHLGNSDLLESLLISVLHREPSASIRIEMIRLLKSLSNDQIDEVLVNLLSDESFKVRKEASLRLIDRKTSKTAELERLLKHEDLETSWPAAFVLGSLGHTTAFPILSKTMQTEDLRYLEMRRCTARLLGSFNSNFSLQILREFLNNDSKRNGFESFVRKEAILSLAHMGYQECIPEFIDNFETGFRDDRVNSIKSFKKLHLESELWKVLEERSLAWQTAAVELGNLGKRRVLPDLCEALIDLGAESASNVIELVAKLADINAIRWLLDALQNPGQHNSDSLFPNRVALALIGSDIKLLENHIQSLISMTKAQYIEQLPWLILAIQQRCQFYNYEIWQKAEKAIQNAELEVQKLKQGDSSGQTINHFPNATEVKIFERVEHCHEHLPHSQNQQT